MSECGSSSNLLEGFLGCKIAREGILPDRSQFDFFLFLDSSIAIAQVVYPDEARKEVTKPEDVRDIALSLRPTVMVLCP